jgi:hypothetical protein
MGDPDPTELINLEIGRLPFKQTTMSRSVWNKTFRAWLLLLNEWRDWYLRVAKTHQTKWVDYDLDQCIALSLSNIKKNEPMLKSASYFWSNAFIFGHGPMTVTLADIHMLTSLRIIGSLQPYNLVGILEHKVQSVRSDGWGGYIAVHKQTQNSSADPKEHADFLNMWLEKYLFYGSSCIPNANYWYLAERLSRGADIPLGKCLIGSLYHLMHEVSLKLMMNEPIGTISGPWWLLQLWMNLHMQKVTVNDLQTLSFPSLNYSEA